MFIYICNGITLSQDWKRQQVKVFTIIILKVLMKAEELAKVAALVSEVCPVCIK